VSETLILVPAGVAGIGLGTLFFGGLWWTVRLGLTSEQPALWFFGSLLLRMSLAMTGVYLVAQGHWQRMLACVLGFFVARWVVTGVTRRSDPSRSAPSHEASHAP
jgi:F1F0 ATPase subunit 2